MKKKWALSSVILVLIIASQACQFPWGETLTPEPDIVTETAELPTSTLTQTPDDTATSTMTSTPSMTPSITPTEEISSPLPVFTNPVIYHFEMFTAMQGWAVTQDRNYLLLTLDGGETWLNATPAGLHPLPAGYTSLGINPFFLDENTAWFTPNSSGSSMLYHTLDGGINWTMTALTFDRPRYFFLDQDDGYALVELSAGAGSHYVAIHRTEDGGLTWTEVFTHEPGEMKSLREGGSKGGITFLDINHGWIGGNIPMTDYFYLYYTTDGGPTWALETDISLPGAYAGSWLEVEQPLFMTSTLGYLPVQALAPDDNFYLLIYRSDDSGETWTFKNSVMDGEVFDFFNLDEGWLVASNGLFQTVDGGANWSLVPTVGIPAGEYFLNVDFVDSLHGWVLTTPDDYTRDPLNFYRTVDGGASWEQLLP